MALSSWWFALDPIQLEAGSMGIWTHVCKDQSLCVCQG